jgi:hypothetical protein
MKLAGTWFNELGSQMDLKVDGVSVTGTYVSAVGKAKGPYAIVGRTEASPDGSQSVGFSVVWENKETGNLGCCTAWSGQLQMPDGGAEQIVTTWILTGDTLAADDWNSTKIGQDTFRRDKPKPLPAGLQKASHPVAATVQRPSKG